MLARWRQEKWVGADLNHAETVASLRSALLLLWFAFVMGYHSLTEWRWGQTLGKYFTVIGVQRVEGGPIGVQASIVHNVLRAVDLFPLFPVVGPMLMATSERQQRFGDRVAGTLVVRT